MKPKVSIVICTCERPASLRKTLIALENLTNDNFEVVIIDASTTTDTLNIVTSLSQQSSYYIKLDKINIKNISVSRNRGIKFASGSIIAFLDDDAIPPPNWIEKLLSIYSLHGNKCGGVGGTVRDMTKSDYPLQYHCGITNIISNTIAIRSGDNINYNEPQGFWYNGLMGANSSYRKDVLEKINGYDEFFEYFLDETDVCLRVIQAAYEIHYCDVVVDHYPQASHNRQDQKHLTCWYSLAKNTTYFALKHALKKIPFPILITRLTILLIYRCFLRIIRLKFTHHLSNKLLWKYIKESIEGIRLGWTAGMTLHKVNESKEN
ncbi:glycosyltransferase family 2 protein [Anabaena sp. PCC 7108]|uniref:glycosyltransferase family 2 protein n=1 Tax=Anabaena sp. PCC 7108 TaxID=163908 RepID=UPI00037A455F|nr:glycosyltransferase family 2 protein [Anabaena sp. PCC 7108]